MDRESQSRIRLWLRSERAFGLSVVGPVARGQAAAVPPNISRDNDDARPSVPLHLSASAVTTAAPLLPKAPIMAKTPATSKAPAKSAVSPVVVPLLTEPIAAPLLTTEQKREQLRLLNENEVAVCVKCRLHETRTNTVFGEGDVDAKIFFIGEGPGETEDQMGRPFVGRAGELLNKQIAAMGLRRDQVFIANIVKCRPPMNRVPAPDEVSHCTPYLQRQLEIVRPQVIVTLGLPASKYMLHSTSTMGRLRGVWHSWRGIKLMPTYHPAFILRAPTYENRSAVWNDLQKVMQEVGLPVPARSPVEAPRQ